MKTPNSVLFNKQGEVETFDKEKFIDSIKQFGEYDSEIIKNGLEELSQYNPVHYSRLVELAIASFKKDDDAKKYYERYHKNTEYGFERLRRITGYLVGTLDRWNDGKKAEESARVKHIIAEKIELEDKKQNQEKLYGKV